MYKGEQKISTPLNGCVALNLSNLRVFADAMNETDFDELFFGEKTKVVSGIFRYPFDVTRYELGGQQGHLQIGAGNFKKTFTGDGSADIRCISLEGLASGDIDNNNRGAEFGYFLGQQDFTNFGGNYSDYEPYTTIEIYLPFYGVITVSPKDVANRWISFFIRIDYTTGQALYIIGVSDTPIKGTNYLDGEGGSIDVASGRGILSIGRLDETSLTHVVIIGQYVFQIGTYIPISTTGISDAVRNIVLGTAKTAVGVAASVAVGNPAPLVTTTTTKIGASSTHTQDYIKEYSGGKTTSLRQGTKTERSGYTAESTRISTRDTTRERVISSAEQAFNTSLNTVANSIAHPHTEISNNTIVNLNSPKEIIIYIKTAKLVGQSDLFKHLYGLPLEDTYFLAELEGYTEISNVHIEGTAFNKATSFEIDLLHSALTSGIIL